MVPRDANCHGVRMRDLGCCSHVCFHSRPHPAPLLSTIAMGTAEPSLGTKWHRPAPCPATLLRAEGPCGCRGGFAHPDPDSSTPLLQRAWCAHTRLLLTAPCHAHAPKHTHPCPWHPTVCRHWAPTHPSVSWKLTLTFFADPRSSVREGRGQHVRAAQEVARAGTQGAPGGDEAAAPDLPPHRGFISLQLRTFPTPRLPLWAHKAPRGDPIPLTPEEGWSQIYMRFIRKVPLRLCSEPALPPSPAATRSRSSRKRRVAAARQSPGMGMQPWCPPLEGASSGREGTHGAEGCSWCITPMALRAAPVLCLLATIPFILWHKRL